MKRHHDRSTSYKGSHFIGAGLQFRGLVHYEHGGKHGGTQLDVVLEEMRVLYLDWQATGREKSTEPGLSF